jgi:hypothetical protein
MAEIKGAVPQPWIVKNSSVATETIEKQKIHSELLKNEHDLSIYIPAGNAADFSRDIVAHLGLVVSGMCLLTAKSATPEDNRSA